MDELLKQISLIDVLTLLAGISAILYTWYKAPREKAAVTANSAKTFAEATALYAGEVRSLKGEIAALEARVDQLSHDFAECKDKLEAALRRLKQAGIEAETKARRRTKPAAS